MQLSHQNWNSRTERVDVAELLVGKFDLEDLAKPGFELIEPQSAHRSEPVELIFKWLQQAPPQQISSTDEKVQAVIRCYGAHCIFRRYDLQVRSARVTSQGANAATGMKCRVLMNGQKPM